MSEMSPVFDLAARARRKFIDKRWFKRSQRGLYHGRMIQFGNQISHSEKKHRRTWLPNVHKVWLRSETLGEKFHWNCSTAAIKTMKKKGGLDRYLDEVPDRLIHAPRAIALKKRVRKVRYEQKCEEKKIWLQEKENEKQQQIVSLKGQGDAVGLATLLEEAETPKKIKYGVRTEGLSSIPDRKGRIRLLGSAGWPYLWKKRNAPVLAHEKASSPQ